MSYHENYTYIKSKFLFLFLIINQSSRQEEIVLTRLRISHTPPDQYSHHQIPLNYLYCDDVHLTV